MSLMLFRKSLFFSLPCFLMFTAVFASDGKSFNALQPPPRPQRHEQAKRKHPDLASRLRSVKVIGIAPPQVKAYHYVNNIPEHRNEWAETGKRGAVTAINAKFDRQSVRTKAVNEGGSPGADLEDVYALYFAIAASIENHTGRGKNLFYDKFASFDYSVGPIGSILDRNRADALLLTTVYGVISSKSLQASQKGGVATAALIDRSGALLWYGNSGVLHGLDIRAESGAQFGVTKALFSFPFEAMP